MQGQYLFSHYYYPKEGPSLALVAANRESTRVVATGQPLTLNFDTSKRYCTGWHNLETDESFACPDAASVPLEYHECRACQQRTGFNPAFYHSDTLSPQQQKRNQTPHNLYLAHFGPGMTKVGISWTQRGIGRLLDQGARSYLLLGTYPTAEAARHYEAKIAGFSSIAEALQQRIKQKLLHAPYDPENGAAELMRHATHIAEVLHIETSALPQHLDPYYFPASSFKPRSLISLHEGTKISGRFIGLIGGALIAEQDETQFMLPLSRLRGYRVTIRPQEEKNQHAPQQASLF